MGFSPQEGPKPNEKLLYKNNFRGILSVGDIMHWALVSCISKFPIIVDNDLGLFIFSCC